MVDWHFSKIQAALAMTRRYSASYCGRIGSLTVTAADCLGVADFQSKWHSYLNALKKIFPTGTWTRERQPRSGNWRAHGAVNVGSDIKPDFPRHQVRRRFYANVDPRLRELWRRSPEKAASHGFGRVELLPLKYGGAACARCFKKYLAKSFGCEKRSGDEKCRLFGVWGVFVSHIHVSHS
jgi:hypothetical protein